MISVSPSRSFPDRSVPGSRFQSVCKGCYQAQDDPSQPCKLFVEWGLQGSTSSSSGDICLPDQQKQQWTRPVMAGSKADSKDLGKVVKPIETSEFKVPEKEFSMSELGRHNKKADL